MADLKTQIEGLQSALRELAEFNAAPVDPIDPSVARPGAYLSYAHNPLLTCCETGPSASASATGNGPRRKYRLELPVPRAAKPSSAKAPEVQLTTPPATPSRGETALLDSAGLGTGLSAACVLPAMLAPASGPARSGSWHGRVRRNGGHRAGARAVFQAQVARDTGDGSEDDEDEGDNDEDEEEDEDIALGGGRCQVRSSALNLFFVSGFSDK